MANLIRFLLPMSVLRPVLRPLIRFVVGMLAIPLFRLFLRRVVRLQELDRELEKDLEEWFRGSLLLLVATANMEIFFFAQIFELFKFDLRGPEAWLAVGLRLLLAMSVIEAMPDQGLFAILHPGPPRLKFPRKNVLGYLREQCRPVCRGLLCRHLNRSSPVLAIMAVIFGGDPHVPEEATHRLVGWICYGAAVTQYLIIGLVTSRDKVLDALAEFDRQVALRRQELIEEFDSHAPQPQAAPAPPTPAPSAIPAIVPPAPAAGVRSVAPAARTEYVSE
jgi:hypothetical protein